MVQTGGKKRHNRTGKGFFVLTRFFIFLFALSVLITPFKALAQDATVVKAEGVAGKSEDAAEVKRKAIDRALKGAVAEAIKELAKKEGIADPGPIDKDALSAPRSYVLNYRVISEGWITHMEPVPVPDSAPEDDRTAPQMGVELYHIWIEASVDNEALRAAIGRAAQNESTYPVTLNILGVIDYGAFKGLVSSLERIALIKDLSYNSFYRGRVTLTAKSYAPNAALAERISRELPEGFVAFPSGQAIIIKSAPRRTE